MSKAFGEHLRKLRKANTNYSQQNMADLLKISRSTYTYYETGKSEPGQVVLKKLCEIFAVDYNTLLNLNSNNKMVADKTLTSEESEIIEAYRKLSAEKKESFKNKIFNL